MDIRKYTHTHTHTYTHIRTHTHTHTHTHMCTHTYKYLHIYPTDVKKKNVRSTRQCNTRTFICVYAFRHTTQTNRNKRMYTLTFNAKIRTP